MKTKLTKIIMTLVVLVGMLLVTACTTTTIIGLEFVDTPNATYMYDLTGTNQVDATVKIIYSDNTTRTVSLSQAAGFGVTVTGDKYDQAAVGNKMTLKVSYGTISISFEYTVKSEPSSLYERGNGTNGDPYIIKSAIQLSNIRYNLDAYFALDNNIDLTGISWTPIEGAFSGQLDGGNNSIINLSAPNNYSGNFAMFVSVKGTTNPAVIKNLKVDASIVNKTQNGYTAALACTTENTTFENVEVSGSIEGVNIGGFVAKASSNTLVKDSENKANLISDSTLVATNPWQIMGGFTAVVETSAKNVKFENFKNSGNMTATYRSAISTMAGQLIGHVNVIASAVPNFYSTKMTEVIIDDSSNGNGIITGNNANNEGDFYGYIYDNAGNVINEYKNHGKTVDTSPNIGLVPNYQFALINDTSNYYQTKARELFETEIQKLKDYDKVKYDSDSHTLDINKIRTDTGGGSRSDIAKYLLNVGFSYITPIADNVYNTDNIVAYNGWTNENGQYTYEFFIILNVPKQENPLEYERVAVNTVLFTVIWAK